MIKLQVEDYCHACVDFEADVRETVYPWMGDGLTKDFEVRCKHRDKCKALKKYLYNQIQKTNGR